MFGEGLTEFILQGGLYLIAATVFVECAFLFGFFLPGDTLLFLAGFISGQGEHNIATTILSIFAAATIGNVVGYRIGEKTGPKIFTKEDGIFFQKNHILQAQEFYERHGGKTLILARFVPVMRTFAPLVAGIANMPFGRFFAYSTIGAALWAVLIPLTGFWAYRVLGHSINIEKYVLPIVLLITVASIGGSVLHAVREGRKKHKKIEASELAKHQAEAAEHLD
ncbi:MAG TPA: DedA family protein [Candidatus Saccharimonadales bacterium]|nr:DedA family protein [Candidatus Saccharimonadales bacterium]